MEQLGPNNFHNQAKGLSESDQLNRQAQKLNNAQDTIFTHLKQRIWPNFQQLQIQIDGQKSILHELPSSFRENSLQSFFKEDPHFNSTIRSIENLQLVKKQASTFICRRKKTPGQTISDFKSQWIKVLKRRAVKKNAAGQYRGVVNPKQYKISLSESQSEEEYLQVLQNHKSM